MLSEPPAADCTDDARALLRAQGLSCERVVSVDRDSILYLNGVGRPRTAWLHRPARGALRVHITPGFACEPPADWHQPLPAERF